MKFIIISTLLPQFLCQYAIDVGMKPDVTFGDHNDRFDLSSLVQRQNRYFDRHTYNDDEDDYRRSGILFTNGTAEDFGFHDPPTGNGGTQADYEQNLKKFLVENSRRSLRLVKRLHEGKGRRSNTKKQVKDGLPDPEKEVLMHYAVPVEMTIEGFLQVPLEGSE